MTSEQGHRPPWLAPLLVVFACDGIAYLALMGRLGMMSAGALVVVACVVRATYLPAARILVAQLFRRTRVRIGVSMVLSGAVYLALLVHLIYAGYFRTVPHFKALHHLDDLPEALSHVMLQLVDLRVLLVVALFLMQACALPRLVKEMPAARLRAALALGLLVFVFVMQDRLARAVHDRFGAVPAERLAVYGLPDAVLRFGFVDLWWSQVEAEVRHLRWPNPELGFPGKIVADAGQERQANGFNLIIVQMESVEPWAIDALVRGQPVMPFLKALQGRSLVFANVFAQHSGGGSSDAELAALLSVLPLATHSGLLTADWTRVSPLPVHLSAHGYATAAMHANRASFFNRDLAYPRLGFEEFMSADGFHGAARGWLSKDRAFLGQSLDKLQALPEPFFALLITMQSHGPFTNHDHRPAADPGPEHRRLERDYLQCMEEVDRALELFVTGLETSGLASRSVLLLVGDHSSQVVDKRVADKEVVPLLVLAPDREAVVIERIGSHLDLAPTAMELLGLAEPEGWLGSSLLARGPGVALFNDLTELRLEHGRLVSRKAEDRLPFLLYSASVLDP